MRRAALYIRVSTDRQTVEHEFAEVCQLAAARGFEPVLYEGVESASKGKVRPVFDQVLVAYAAAAWAGSRVGSRPAALSRRQATGNAAAVRERS